MGLFPSKFVPDSDYLLARSITEAILAANARTAQAEAAHHQIAACYLARLFGDASGDESDTMPATRIVDRPLAHIARRTSAQPDLRFADLRLVPEDEDLTRLLLRLA